MNGTYKKGQGQQACEDKIEQLAAEYLIKRRNPDCQLAAETAKTKLLNKCFEYIDTYRNDVYMNLTTYGESEVDDSRISKRSYIFDGILELLNSKAIKENEKFIPYMITSVKHNSRRIYNKDNQFDSSKKEFDRIMRYLECKTNTKVTFEMFAQFVREFKSSWTEDKVKNLWMYGGGMVSLSLDSVISDNGSETTLESIITNENTLSVESISIDESQKIVQIIQTCFEKKKDPSPDYLSALITISLAEGLLQIDELHKGILQKYTFVDQTLLNELKSGANPQLKDIAKRFGKDPTTASRKWREQFLPTLQKAMEEAGIVQGFD